MAGDTLASQDAKALRILALPVLEGTIPAPAAILCSSGDAKDAAKDALGLVAMPVPEEVLPAPATIVCCSGHAQDAAKDALGLVALPVPEGFLPAPATIVCCSGDPQDAMPEGTELAAILCCSGDAQDSSELRLLAVPEGSKSKVGCGLLPVGKIQVVRSCARPTDSPSAGIAGVLSVRAPKEIRWGLLPAAARQVWVGRCAASSNPLGEALPFGEMFGIELPEILRAINCSTLVGHHGILVDLADSAEIMESAVKSFTPILIEYISDVMLIDSLRMGTLTVGTEGTEPAVIKATPFIKMRASDITTAVEMVRAQALDGYIMEETLVNAILKVRQPASRLLRSSPFGRSVDLLRPPYAGTAPKVQDKVVHFIMLADEFHCLALALEAGLSQLFKE